MRNSSVKHTLFSIFFIALITTPATNAFSVDGLVETNNLVKAGGKFVTLLGEQLEVGDQAPSFKVVDKNFSPVKLSDFANQTLLISVVPSLDTGVCSIQTKRFNDEAATLPKNITTLTISNDLPFAQKRFCDSEGVDSMTVLSDSVWRDFGTKYGLLIKNMGLLTRAIFIINDQGEIVYKELVANISQQPNYDKALTQVRYTAPVMVIDTSESKPKAEPYIEE
jgi:thiol peroxidase